MNRRAIEIDGGVLLAYGHYGRPVVVFPSEENRSSNLALAAALAAQGYATEVAEIADGHTWTCWRDAFDPNLHALIEAVS